MTGRLRGYHALQQQPDHEQLHSCPSLGPEYLRGLTEAGTRLTQYTGELHPHVRPETFEHPVREAVFPKQCLHFGFLLAM